MHTIKNHQGLRMLVINFQSIYSKGAEFWSLLEATKPDVIIGCETWLKSSMMEKYSLLPTTCTGKTEVTAMEGYSLEFITASIATR